MSVSASAQMSVAALALGVLGACAGTTHEPDGSGGDCESHYAAVAEAPTWTGLREAMLGYQELGRVVSLRTQARGTDVGSGDQDAVRVVDLLDRNGRRLAQVDVWRTAARSWKVGAWQQCID